MGKHCDIGHIFHPKSRVELEESLPNVLDNRTVLALNLEVAPYIKSNLLPPGSYELDLKIAALVNKRRGNLNNLKYCERLHHALGDQSDYRIQPWERTASFQPRCYEDSKSLLLFLGLAARLLKML